MKNEKEKNFRNEVVPNKNGYKPRMMHLCNAEAKRLAPQKKEEIRYILFSWLTWRIFLYLRLKNLPKQNSPTWFTNSVSGDFIYFFNQLGITFLFCRIC